uniref:Uncharacterized protein n=1 Tax=Arion vulgaris TaxID=1028688 RepID=A0A0B6Z2U9_9EUPU
MQSKSDVSECKYQIHQQISENEILILSKLSSHDLAMSETSTQIFLLFNQQENKTNNK